MHPFLNYEVAKGIVEDMRVVSKRRNEWRRSQTEAVPTPRSWDAEAIRLLAMESDGEQEKVGA